jgi:pyruvate-formate lyase-activating enzyme
MNAAKVPPDKELLAEAVSRRNPTAERISEQSKQLQIDSLRGKLEEAEEKAKLWRKNYLVLSIKTEDDLEILTSFVSSLDTDLPEEVQKVVADYMEQKFAYSKNKEAQRLWKEIKERLKNGEDSGVLLMSLL